MHVFLFYILTSSFAAATHEEFKFIWHEGPPSKVEVLDRATVRKVLITPKITLDVLNFERPLRTTLRQLQRESGGVICDCGLFVEIMARLEAEEDPAGVLLATDTNPSQYIACACHRDLAYLRPADVDTFLSLQNTSFPGKGHWLLPLEGGRYLGILRNGPREGSAAEWKRWARKELLAEYAECSERLVRERVDDWTITPIPQTLVPRRYRVAVRRLFQSPGGER